MVHTRLSKVTLAEDDQSRWKHVAILVACMWICIFLTLVHMLALCIKKNVVLCKTRLTDIHHAAYLSGDVCDLKDHPMCAWFESQAGQWLSFLRCFMFFLIPSFLPGRCFITTPLRYSCCLLRHFHFNITNCVICINYINWNTPSIVKWTQFCNSIHADPEKRVNSPFN
jgi:hypothetical protein